MACLPPLPPIMALSLTNMSLLKRPPILDFILLTHTTLGSEEPMKIPTDLSDNICPKAPRWRHLLKQSAMRLHTNLTTDPELVWAFKLRRNVLLDIIADRCTSNLILSVCSVVPFFINLVHLCYMNQFFCFFDTCFIYKKSNRNYCCTETKN